jgi:hypothetical protein
MTRHRKASNSGPPRTLEEIGDELSFDIKNDTAGALRIGQLLNEAKAVAGHGRWLPFLKRYRIEAKTAQNRMKAASWADTKYEGHSYLDLGLITLDAILALASGKYGDDVVEQVIGAAQHRHIGLGDVKAIAKSGARAPIIKEIVAEQKAQDEAEAAAEVAQEVELVEAPPPPPPPPPPSSPRDYGDPRTKSILKGPPDPTLPRTPEPSQKLVEDFEGAIKLLNKLRSMSLALLATAKVSSDDLDHVVFLMQDVKQHKKWC